MGRRNQRRKPTRREKIGRSEGKNVRRSEDQPARKISPETKDLVEGIAKIMGWDPERVLESYKEVSA